MNALKLTLAWLWVGLPLAWGITQSISKAMPLFSEGITGTGTSKGHKTPDKP